MTRPLLRARWPLPLSAALIAALLAGCQVLPIGKAQPTGDPAAAPVTTNSACAESCNLQKTQCEQRQALREQDCQASRSGFESGAERCPTRVGTHCVEPVACLGQDLSICETLLAECLSECGSEPATAPAPAIGTGEALKTEPTTDPGEKAAETK